MTETTPTHAEDPAEGADTETTGTGGRTPHTEQPAEGADDPAETEERARSGVDPQNRITRG